MEYMFTDIKYIVVNMTDLSNFKRFCKIRNL